MDQTGSDITPFYPLPPSQVERFVDILGVESTIDFLLNFGGSEVYIPETPKGKSDMEKVLGRAKMARLYEVADTLKIRVPLANIWLAQCLDAQGLSAAAIARRLRISDVTVRKYIRGPDAPTG